MRELGPGRVDTSGDKIKGLGLTDAQIGQIAGFLVIAATKGAAALDKAEALMGKIQASEEGLDELRKILGILADMEINLSRAEIDLTIVRGLGYYTGPVFETILLDLPEFGSVFAGGRYDNLVDRFSGRSVPAVGASVGIDRLLAALIQLKKIELKESTSEVLVTVMDRERLSDYLRILRQLRNAGIPSEIFAGDTKNLTKQIKYGDKVGIPFAVIAGSEEFEAGTLTVKNLAAGKQKAMETTDREEWLKADEIQETIPASSLVSYIEERLKTNK